MAPFRIAILWRGDREARRTASAQNNRYHRIFEELSGLGIHAEPAVYDEEFAVEVCEQLLKVDSVLVWVDPLSRGKTRGAGAFDLGHCARWRHSPLYVRAAAERCRPASCAPLGWLIQSG